MSPENKPTTPQDDFNAAFLESRKRIFRNTRELLQGKIALVPKTVIAEQFALPYKSGLAAILSCIKKDFRRLGYSEEETEEILEIPASKNSSKPPNQIK